MSSIPSEHALNLTTVTYRPALSDPRPSFMSFQTSSDMSPQAAMAAALAAAQSSAVSADVHPQPDFSRTSVTSIDPTSDPMSMRLPNLDLSIHRQQRPFIPNYSGSPSSLPLSSSLPPVQPTPLTHANTSASLTALPSSYSHSLPISHLTSDHIPYPSRPPCIPSISYPVVTSTTPTTAKPSDQGIIPAAAQLIDTTVNRGRGRAMTGAVRKKATTTRRRKARTGPANFVCALVGCGKAFRMHGDLQTHMRKHTGDEPFACSFPDCGMRYKWRSSLSHHEGLHRKAKDFRLKPRRRRRSTATMLAIPPEQLMQTPSVSYGDPQASLGSTGQPSLVATNGQTALVGTAAQSTLVTPAGQAGLVSAAPLGRLS